MLPYVIKAELRGDYRIYVEFNDGLNGIIDFKDKITTDHREIIRELIDKNKFIKSGLNGIPYVGRMAWILLLNICMTR